MHNDEHSDAVAVGDVEKICEHSVSRIVEIMLKIASYTSKLTSDSLWEHIIVAVHTYTGKNDMNMRALKNHSFGNILRGWNHLSY